jgi:nucleotide-binding universal stress UspA family protein
MQNFLEAIARSLRADNLEVRVMITGSLAVRTIVSVSDKESVDMIMMTSRGRSGLESWFTGNVAGRVVEQCNRPVFMVPITPNNNNSETKNPS